MLFLIFVIVRIESVIVALFLSRRRETRRIPGLLSPTRIQKDSKRPRPRSLGQVRFMQTIPRGVSVVRSALARH